MSIEKHFSPYDMHPPVRKFITHEGKTLSVLDWGRLLGIRSNTLYQRMRTTTDSAKILSTATLRKRV